MVLEVRIVSTFEDTGEDMFGEERERGFSSGMWSKVYFLACIMVKCGKSTWARHFGGKHFSVYVWCFTIKSFYILFFKHECLSRIPDLWLSFDKLWCHGGGCKGLPWRRLPFFLPSLSIKCRQRSYDFSLLFVNMVNWYFQTWNYPVSLWQTSFGHDLLFPTHCWTLFSKYFRILHLCSWQIFIFSFPFYNNSSDFSINVMLTS